MDARTKHRSNLCHIGKAKTGTEVKEEINKD
jgi:hypothetical protein